MFYPIFCSRDVFFLHKHCFYIFEMFKLGWELYNRPIQTLGVPLCGPAYYHWFSFFPLQSLKCKWQNARYIKCLYIIRRFAKFQKIIALATSKSEWQMTECKIHQMFIYQQEICKVSKNYSSCHFKVWIANDKMQDNQMFIYHQEICKV